MNDTNLEGRRPGATQKFIKIPVQGKTLNTYYARLIASPLLAQTEYHRKHIITVLGFKVDYHH
jgi:hypothetical protein